MAYEDGKRENQVGLGIVTTVTGTFHFSPISEDSLVVSVQECFATGYKVWKPVTTDEDHPVQFLDEAVGQFILWPKIALRASNPLP